VCVRERDADREIVDARRHSCGYLRKTAFLHHLCIKFKTIILPRQARDKHRENSKKSGVFRTAVGEAGHADHHGGVRSKFNCSRD
jgi:hypothetical protein